jgi:hypothetical protein
VSGLAEPFQQCEPVSGGGGNVGWNATRKNGNSHKPRELFAL